MHQQRLGDARQRFRSLVENPPSFVVTAHDDLLNFPVDFGRGGFAVVPMSCDLFAEEDLSCGLAVCQRPQALRHAPLRDHLARQHRGPLEVLAGTTG